MKLFTRTVIALLLSFALVASAFAASHSAVGYWQTIDAKSGKVSSIIKIWKQRGLYFGKVYKSFPENSSGQAHDCQNCKGKNDKKSALGMTIITNMQFENGQYVNGKILDPTSGKVYKAKMWVVDNGKRLKVRGYVGFSLLGKTVVWVRGKTNKIGR